MELLLPDKLQTSDFVIKATKAGQRDDYGEQDTSVSCNSEPMPYS